MRKNIWLTLIISLFFSMTFLNVNLALASSLSGSSCKKFGSITHQGNQTFTCLRAGTKLTWSLGSKKTSQASTTSDNANMPVPPTSFFDLFDHRNGIAYGAWSKFSTILKSQPKVMPTIETYHGPNTSVYVKDPTLDFKFTSRLFPNVELPKKIVIIYWSNNDMNWATNKATELMGQAEMQKIIDETGGPFVDCYMPTNCNVGHAHIGPDGTAYIGLGNPDNVQGDKNFPLGQKEEIEFYHALQLMYYFKNHSPITTKDNKPSSNFPPAWLNMAGENFTFDAMRFENDYKGFSSAQNFTGWMNQIGHPVTPDWLDNYLNIKNLNNDWSLNGFKNVADNNCFGSSIVEILVSLKGPSVLLDFHDQMSQGKSFQDAFKTEFGTSWEEAAPVISKVIYDKYKNNY